MIEDVRVPVAASPAVGRQGCLVDGDRTARSGAAVVSSQVPA
jgi:hypothetical protein